ncbi:MAG: hypothetical protein WC889_17600 [Myxococcota bacterium]
MKIVPFKCARCGREMVETEGFCCSVCKDILCHQHKKAELKDGSLVCDKCCPTIDENDIKSVKAVKKKDSTLSLSVKGCLMIAVIWIFFFIAIIVGALLLDKYGIVKWAWGGL